jgi:hypothetical protein
MEKIISGSDLRETDEKRTWRCSLKTKEGEIVTIPLDIILRLLADYNIVADIYRNHCRAKDITRR